MTYIFLKHRRDGNYDLRIRALNNRRLKLPTYTIPADAANHKLYDLDQALHPGFHTLSFMMLELQAEADGVKFGRAAMTADDYEFKLIQDVPRDPALYDTWNTYIRNNTGAGIFNLP